MSIFVAFIIALLFSLLFSSGYRKSGSLVPLGMFFLILFMATLAGHYWIVPFGPILWGVAWLPLIFIGIISALLFVVPSPRTKIRDADSKANDADLAVAGISVFIWILFIVFLIAVIAGHYK